MRDLQTLLLLLALTLCASPAPAQSQTSRAVHVGIVVWDRVQIIDFTAPYEVFGQAGFKVSTISKDGKPVTANMGLKITPDMSLAQAKGFDVVLVPGGRVKEAMADKELQAWLRERANDAQIVMSVCTGSHVLAASGLLNNLTATTFHKAFDAVSSISPTTKVVRDARWVDTGKIITTAGLSSGVDGALHVVERLLGSERARTIAMTLEYDWRPEHGFVRGTMADRHLPRPSIDWPTGSNIDLAAAYGDENMWFERYRLAGPATVAQYWELIRTAFEGTSGWSRKESSADRLVLVARPENGMQASLRVELLPTASDGSFEVTSRLALTR